MRNEGSTSEDEWSHDILDRLEDVSSEEAITVTQARGQGRGPEGASGNKRQLFCEGPPEFDN